MKLSLVFLRLGALVIALPAIAACRDPDPAPPPSTAGEETSTRANALASYTAPCGPKACDGIPLPPAACADGTTPVVKCFPRADGVCRIDVSCGASVPPVPPPADAGPATPSFRPCDPSACGANPPPIACADGSEPQRTCGDENELGCRWITSCTPPPSTTPCANDTACGPPPAIAVSCPPGKVMDAACMKVANACQWQYGCK